MHFVNIYLIGDIRPAWYEAVFAAAAELKTDDLDPKVTTTPKYRSGMFCANAKVEFIVLAEPARQEADEALHHCRELVQRLASMDRKPVVVLLWGFLRPFLEHHGITVVRGPVEMRLREHWATLTARPAFTAAS